jgi:hypothetical protein
MAALCPLTNGIDSSNLKSGCSMDDKTTRSLDLQRAISSRLAELAYADTTRAELISRHLAEIASTSKDFGENTLPLFLRIDRDDPALLMQVALAIKAQMEELTDALVDLRRELPEWAEFFIQLPKR